jgi:hypothetical protein
MNSPQAFGLWHFCEVTNGSEFAVQINHSAARFRTWSGI